MNATVVSINNHLSPSSSSDPLPFDINLSVSEIKKYFYIWFNSITTATDGSINLIQFRTILNKIFSTSLLTTTEINLIFNELLIDNSNNMTQDPLNLVIYPHIFLHSSNNQFSSKIMQLLSTSSNNTTINALKSVPSTTNNSCTSTQHQILYDQTIEIHKLRSWIIDIGLPSHSRRATLENELSSAVYNKQRLNIELSLINEDIHLAKQSAMSSKQLYNQLNDNYAYLKQENNHLKVKINAMFIENGKLDKKSKNINNKLKEQVNINKNINIKMNNVLDINEKYKKTNNQIQKQKDNCEKQLIMLRSFNSQLEIALESTSMALEERQIQIKRLNEELSKANEHHELFKLANISSSKSKRLSDYPSDDNLENDLTPKNKKNLRLTVTGADINNNNIGSLKINTNNGNTSSKDLFPSKKVHRKSYVFAIRTPMNTLPDIYTGSSFESCQSGNSDDKKDKDKDKDKDNNLSSRTLPGFHNFSSLASIQTTDPSVSPPPPQFQTNTSVLTIGNGQYGFNNSLDPISESLNKIHSDNLHGVDIYVLDDDKMDKNDNNDINDNDNDDKYPPVNILTLNNTNSFNFMNSYDDDQLSTISTNTMGHMHYQYNSNDNININNNNDDDKINKIKLEYELKLQDIAYIHNQEIIKLKNQLKEQKSSGLLRNIAIIEETQLHEYKTDPIDNDNDDEKTHNNNQYINDDNNDNDDDRLPLIPKNNKNDKNSKNNDKNKKKAKKKSKKKKKDVPKGFNDNGLCPICSWTAF